MIKLEMYLADSTSYIGRNMLIMAIRRYNLTGNKLSRAIEKMNCIVNSEQMYTN